MIFYLSYYLRIVSSEIKRQKPNADHSVQEPSLRNWEAFTSSAFLYVYDVRTLCY
jgi:hypothetical protein